jgi:tripartite-type tricarboxylate transporter receptor subunit TctC
LSGKKFKAIAVASPTRLSTLPDVPTVSEQGIKGFEGYAWQGLVVPTGTSHEATAKFAHALQQALGQTVVKARLQAMGLETLPGTPEHMASFARAERDKWGAVITKIGVKLD